MCTHPSLHSHSFRNGYNHRRNLNSRNATLASSSGASPSWLSRSTATKPGCRSDHTLRKVTAAPTSSADAFPPACKGKILSAVTGVHPRPIVGSQYVESPNTPSPWSRTTPTPNRRGGRPRSEMKMKRTEKACEARCRRRPEARGEKQGGKRK